MQKWIALFLLLFLGLAAPLQAQVTAPNAQWQQLTCSLPWGGSLNTGSSTTAYQASSVACGNSCASESRACTGNVLSGSYQYSSCSVGACASCGLPWGGSISHGQSVTAYAASSVPCGNSCTSQTRTCNNGSLSGSYGYSSCSVGACCGGSGAVCSNDGQCCSGWCGDSGRCW
jgi:hypothetical protein